jgi:hypothetical protein
MKYLTLKKLEDVLLEVLNLEQFEVFLSFSCLYSSTLTDAFVHVYVSVLLILLFFLFYLKSKRQVCYVSYHKLCLIDVCLLPPSSSGLNSTDLQLLSFALMVSSVLSFFILQKKRLRPRNMCIR